MNGRHRKLKERAHRHGFLAQQKGRRGRSRIRELDVTVDNLPVVKDIALVRHSGERNLGAGERTARVARGRAALARLNGHVGHRLNGRHRKLKVCGQRSVAAAHAHDGLGSVGVIDRSVALIDGPAFEHVALIRHGVHADLGAGLAAPGSAFDKASGTMAINLYGQGAVDVKDPALGLIELKVPVAGCSVDMKRVLARILAGLALVGDGRAYLGRKVSALPRGLAAVDKLIGVGGFRIGLAADLGGVVGLNGHLARVDLQRGRLGARRVLGIAQIRCDHLIGAGLGGHAVQLNIKRARCAHSKVREGQLGALERLVAHIDLGVHGLRGTVVLVDLIAHRDRGLEPADLEGARDGGCGVVAAQDVSDLGVAAGLGGLHVGIGALKRAAVVGDARDQVANLCARNRGIAVDDLRTKVKVCKLVAANGKAAPGRRGIPREGNVLGPRCDGEVAHARRGLVIAARSHRSHQVDARLRGRTAEGNSGASQAQILSGVERALKGIDHLVGILNTRRLQGEPKGCHVYIVVEQVDEAVKRDTLIERQDRVDRALRLAITHVAQIDREVALAVAIDTGDNDNGLGLFIARRGGNQVRDCHGVPIRNARVLDLDRGRGLGHGYGRGGLGGLVGAVALELHGDGVLAHLLLKAVDLKVVPRKTVDRLARYLVHDGGGKLAVDLGLQGIKILAVLDRGSRVHRNVRDSAPVDRLDGERDGAGGILVVTGIADPDLLGVLLTKGMARDRVPGRRVVKRLPHIFNRDRAGIVLDSHIAGGEPGRHAVSSIEGGVEDNLVIRLAVLAQDAHLGTVDANEPGLHGVDLEDVGLVLGELRQGERRDLIVEAEARIAVAIRDAIELDGFHGVARSRFGNNGDGVLDVDRDAGTGGGRGTADGQALEVGRTCLVNLDGRLGVGLIGYLNFGIGVVRDGVVSIGVWRHGFAVDLDLIDLVVVDILDRKGLGCTLVDVIVVRVCVRLTVNEDAAELRARSVSRALGDNGSRPIAGEGQDAVIEPVGLRELSNPALLDRIDAGFKIRGAIVPAP